MSYFFYGYAAHLDLHSFPTRRSSDLTCQRRLARGRTALQQAITARLRQAGEWAEGDDPATACALLLAKLRGGSRSEEHTSELQSRLHLVCRLLLEKKKKKQKHQENNN